jgi:hypothetical protein
MAAVEPVAVVKAAAKGETLTAAEVQVEVALADHTVVVAAAAVEKGRGAETAAFPAVVEEAVEKVSLGEREVTE